MEELIARLEAAQAADRGLDWEITLAISTRTETRDGLNGIAFTPLRFAGFTMHDCPTFSASLDAALALVPEGHFWETGADEDGRAFAAVVHPEDGYKAVNAPTAPLALVIAALRARAARA